MEFTDNFIPSLKEAFGGVNYINLTDHFLQRWEQRKRNMGEETICQIVADWMAHKPLTDLESRFLIKDCNKRARIACEQKPFRLPGNQVGKLINVLTIF